MEQKLVAKKSTKPAAKDPRATMVNQMADVFKVGSSLCGSKITAVESKAEKHYFNVYTADGMKFKVRIRAGKGTPKTAKPAAKTATKAGAKKAEPKVAAKVAETVEAAIATDTEVK